MKRKLETTCALLAVAAGVVATDGAQAFVPAAQNAQYEIPMAVVDHHTNLTPDVIAARRGAEQAIEASLGGRWRVYTWNAQTATARSLYGTGVDAGPSLASDIAAETTARAFIGAHPEVFHADVANLRLDAIGRGLGKVGVHFQQTYHGLDVVGAKVYGVFQEDTGRLFVMGSDYHRAIDVSPTPRLSADEAIAIAQGGVAFDPATDRIDGAPALVVVPVPTSASQALYRLAWRVKVVTEDPIGIWVTHVDAHTGDVFWRFNDVRFLDYSGESDFDTQPITYCDGDVPAVNKYQDVTVEGIGTVTTDAAGNWTVPNGDETPRTVTAGFVGPYCTVQNFGGTESVFSATATPGVPLEIFMTSPASQADERDAFDAVNDIHDYFAVLDPLFTLPTTQMDANVSRDDVCNAYWNGTINFYREGGGCANTGEIQGVVHHEYGHGVQNSLIGGQGGEGLGEGNADVLANFMTRESIIGRGFNLGNCSSGIRNSNNNLRYPGDVVGHEEHSAGRVIAGFHWDASENLRARLGEEAGWAHSGSLWHNARKVARPESQPEQVLATFAADDDDANLLNGTPNYLELCAAAEHHGFTCPASPGVHFVGGRVGNTTNHSTPIAITARPFSTDGTIAPSSVTLHYRENGGSFVDVVMTGTSTPDEYTANVATQALGNKVEYYLSASDNLGNDGTAPEGAPGTLWDFYVASHYDPFEAADAGWVVGLPDDDATNGIWERVDPTGTAAQASTDNTPAPGVAAWITGQHQGAEGGWQGESNVNTGKTTLTSAVYDVSGSTDFVRLRYNRWFSNDTGANPNQDPWIVRVSNDGGPWMEIENTTASDRSWLAVETDLMALFGGSVGEIQVQFEASDYSPPAIVEAGVDDFTILADLGEGTVAVEPVAPGVPAAAYLAARPNPFNPRTTIRYGTTAAGAVELSIFDVNGRRVRGLVNTRQDAGHHAVAWDGTSDAGQALPSGVYYYRVVAPGGAITHAVTLLK